MSNNEKIVASVVLIGGPDSGKTNFITRLWLAILDNAGCIKQDGLPNHLEYLQSGGQTLLSGEFIGHTAHDVYNETIIPCLMTKKGNAEKGNLIVPDCSGERWMSIYNKREWSTQWEGHFSENTGCLIFVRATSDQIVSPLDWVQCERLWGGAMAPNDSEKYSPPTQVVITEWLQFIRSAFVKKIGNGVRPRVGIVVAAWDRVPQESKASGPMAYVAQEFPLLAQFIHANDDLFNFAVFGTSIAGGDFDHEPGFKEKCLEQNDPLENGYVIHELFGSPQQAPDLTLPVAWAMGVDIKSGDA